MQLHDDGGWEIWLAIQACPHRKLGNKSSNRTHFSYSARVMMCLGPTHGTLVLLDDPTTSLKTFSLDTLKAGQVVYSHNSSSRHQYDHLLFQASDGFNILNVLFHVEIRFKASIIFRVGRFNRYSNLNLIRCT